MISKLMLYPLQGGNGSRAERQSSKHCSQCNDNRGQGHYLAVSVRIFRCGCCCCFAQRRRRARAGLLLLLLGCYNSGLSFCRVALDLAVIVILLRGPWPPHATQQGVKLNAQQRSNTLVVCVLECKLEAYSLYRSVLGQQHCGRCALKSLSSQGFSAYGPAAMDSAHMWPQPLMLHLTGY